MRKDDILILVVLIVLICLLLGVLTYFLGYNSGIVATSQGLVHAEIGPTKSGSLDWIIKSGPLTKLPAYGQ